MIMVVVALNWFFPSIFMLVNFGYNAWASSALLGTVGSRQAPTSVALENLDISSRKVK